MVFALKGWKALSLLTIFLLGVYLFKVNPEESISFGQEDDDYLGIIDTGYEDLVHPFIQYRDGSDQLFEPEMIFSPNGDYYVRVNGDSTVVFAFQGYGLAIYRGTGAGLGDIELTITDGLSREIVHTAILSNIDVEAFDHGAFVIDNLSPDTPYIAVLKSADRSSPFIFDGLQVLDMPYSFFWGSYDNDMDERFLYMGTGAWEYLESSDAIGGVYFQSRTGTTEDELIFYIEGASFTIYRHLGSEYGDIELCAVRMEIPYHAMTSADCQIAPNSQETAFSQPYTYVLPGEAIYRVVMRPAGNLPISFDGLEVGGAAFPLYSGYYENTDELLLYSGNWQIIEDSPTASSGSYHAASYQAGSNPRLSFTLLYDATHLILYRAIGGDYGDGNPNTPEMKVCIAELCYLVDNDEGPGNDVFLNQGIVFPLNSFGEDTSVYIEALENASISVDAIEVLASNNLFPDVYINQLSPFIRYNGLPYMADANTIPANPRPDTNADLLPDWMPSASLNVHQQQALLNPNADAAIEFQAMGTGIILFVLGQADVYGENHTFGNLVVHLSEERYQFTQTLTVDPTNSETQTLIMFFPYEFYDVRIESTGNGIALDGMAVLTNSNIVYGGRFDELEAAFAQIGTWENRYRESSGTSYTFAEEDAILAFHSSGQQIILHIMPQIIKSNIEVCIDTLPCQLFRIRGEKGNQASRIEIPLEGAFLQDDNGTDYGFHQIAIHVRRGNMALDALEVIGQGN